MTDAPSTTEFLTASQLGLSLDFPTRRVVHEGENQQQVAKVQVNGPGKPFDMLEMRAMEAVAGRIKLVHVLDTIQRLASFYLDRISPKLKIEPTIQLTSGRYFNFLDPDSTPLQIDDIASGLSRICRFTGQVREDVDHYSVAQHCVLASILIEDQTQAYHALMHDSAESVIGDMNSPLKQLCPDYKRVEARVEASLSKLHGFPAHMTVEVKQADLRILATEKRDLMPVDQDDTDEWKWLPEPYDFVIQPWSARFARDAFLARWAELTDKHDAHS